MCYPLKLCFYSEFTATSDNDDEQDPGYRADMPTGRDVIRLETK